MRLKFPILLTGEEAKEIENKMKQKEKWNKDNLRRLIEAAYSAHQEPHSSSAVINETTDFLDKLHQDGLAQVRQEAVEGLIKKLKTLNKKGGWFGCDWDKDEVDIFLSCGIDKYPTKEKERR